MRKQVRPNKQENRSDRKERRLKSMNTGEEDEYW
jgi:hypothetical protein